MLVSRRYLLYQVFFSDVGREDISKRRAAIMPLLRQQQQHCGRIVHANPHDHELGEGADGSVPAGNCRYLHGKPSQDFLAGRIVAAEGGASPILVSGN
ncbi:hypothetical protein IHE45_17G091200 [Dioscorea alata]|uniref:Uncharacterized protein n=1 Tax=Dioscorea alata TaxID=55571 RepID=A0ACB7UDV9_DIOAL|nr:hypothetical protein IHE45_17G091200 [Dioscorea alata]